LGYVKIEAAAELFVRRHMTGTRLLTFFRS
jgi:hypothetical protein